MNNPLTIDSTNLQATLAESNVEMLRGFARACGVDFQQNWSGLDLVVFARRWATYQQQASVVAAIDRSIVNTWADVADRLCSARARNGKADIDLLKTTWVRSLGLLTERFPASAVHDAFVLAMLAVARKIQLLSVSARATAGGLGSQVEPEATLFTPIWLRTINRVAPDRMQEVFRDCRVMFHSGDYFAGYVVAWRYGEEVAARYALALKCAIPSAKLHPLPLGSEQQLLELKKIIVGAMSSARVGTTDISVVLTQLFAGLKGPLSAWSMWLADVFRDTPTLTSPARMPFTQLENELAREERILEDVWADEDPAQSDISSDFGPDVRLADDPIQETFGPSP